MRAFKRKRARLKGSSLVEAAIVFPIVIVVLYLLMKMGMSLYEKTGKCIAEDSGYSESILYPKFSAEKELRIKWIGKELLFGDD